MSPTAAVTVLLALLALTTATACLLAPRFVGRTFAGIGVFTAPWMDVRLTSWLTLSDLFLAASIPPLLASTDLDHFWRRFVHGPSRWLLVVGALFLTGGLIGAVTSPGDDGIEVAVKFSLSLIVVTIVIWCYLTDNPSWFHVTTLFVAGAAVSAAVALANPGAYGQGRSLGLTNHPNHLGFSMLLAIALAVANLASTNTKHRLMTVVSLPLLTYALLASGSRAALIGLAVWAAVAVFVSRRIRTPALAFGSLALLALALVLPGTIDSGPSALSRTLAPSNLETASTAARAANFDEALEMIAERPVLGHGFFDALTFHSVPLQFIVVGGVMGLGAMAVAGVFLKRMLAIAWRRGSPLSCRSSAAGVVGAFVTLLFSNQMFDRYVMLGLTLLSAGVWIGSSTGRMSVHADQPVHLEHRRRNHRRRQSVPARRQGTLPRTPEAPRAEVIEQDLNVSSGWAPDIERAVHES